MRRAKGFGADDVGEVESLWSVAASGGRLRSDAVKHYIRAGSGAADRDAERQERSMPRKMTALKQDLRAHWAEVTAEGVVADQAKRRGFYRTKQACG